MFGSKKLKERIISLTIQNETLTNFNKFLGEEIAGLKKQVAVLQEALVAKEAPLSYNSLYPPEKVSKDMKAQELMKQITEFSAAQEDDLFSTPQDMFDILLKRPESKPLHRDGES